MNNGIVVLVVTSDLILLSRAYSNTFQTGTLDYLYIHYLNYNNCSTEHEESYKEEAAR